MQVGGVGLHWKDLFRLDLSSMHQKAFIWALYCLSMLISLPIWSATQHLHQSREDCQTSFSIYSVPICTVVSRARVVGIWPITNGELHVPYGGAIPTLGLNVIVNRNYSAMGLSADMLNGLMVRNGFVFRTDGQVWLQSVPDASLTQQSDVLVLYSNKPLYYWPAGGVPPAHPFQERGVQLETAILQCPTSAGTVSGALVCYYRTEPERQNVYQIELNLPGRNRLLERVEQFPIIEKLLHIIRGQKF